MHPLITAWITLRALQDMNIRTWSPYFGMWVEMLDEQRMLIREFDFIKA